MATTPTATATRRHARQDSNNGGGIPPLRPQPSSPTLTNPDMILPDYEYPEQSHGTLQHLPPGWSDMPADSDHMFDFSETVDPSVGYPLNTPIIYGNGTMLSDIGEVTEVESNVGGPRRQLSGRSNISARSTHSDDNVVSRLASPPNSTKYLARRTTPTGAGLARDGSAPVDLAHTNPANHAAAFADFDDTISVDDSNFQGDDEESVASFYTEHRSMPRNGIAPGGSASAPNVDRYSTSSISRRAEQILANAKRRLTTMEDNLSRARTLSYSTVSDGSTPSPMRTGASSGLRTPVHARNISETSLSTTPTQPHMPKRSASALGAAGGYRQPLPQSRSADAVMRTAHGISRHPLDVALEPLSESEGTHDLEDHSDSTQVAGYASPTFNGYNEAGVARSTSAAQMRGIQDQMKGLKGKIFSLREQAAADSMKRRSLQSLRTPSLFTHARVDGQDSDPRSTQTPDQQGSPALGSPFEPEFSKEDINPPLVEEEVQCTPPWQRTDRDLVVSRHSPMRNLHQAYLNDENTPPKSKAAAAEDKFDKIEQSSYTDEDDDDDLHTQNGDAQDLTEDQAPDDLDAADRVSESGESLYHETYQHPISHEDREDAFDYEHFFLHSAMGHVSRQGFHNSDDDSDSDCSDDSAATTRAMPMMVPLGRPRRASLDTLTSVDTFATALEGRTSRASEADEGYESPIAGVAQVAQLQSSQSENHLMSGTRGSGSGSEGSRSSQERAALQRSFSYRPTVMANSAVGQAKRPAVHRPSVSSFESIGTNRSFPLINKARTSADTTPRDSPDQMMRYMRSPPQSRRSSVNEQAMGNISNGSTAGSANGCFNGSVNGSVRSSASGHLNGSVHVPTNGSEPVDISGSSALPSPTMQPLTGKDQTSVDLLLASIDKCTAGLRDVTLSGVKMHDTYRRRLEAARLILDGAPDSF